MLSEKIKKLEKEGLDLELDSSSMESYLDYLKQFSESYISSLDHTPVFSDDDSVLQILEDTPISEEGMDQESVLKIMEESVITPGINAASSGHLGYIPGGGVFLSAVGDFIAAVSNKFAGLYFSAPGAVKIENQCIRWTADLIGYPDTALGNMTSGGSIANLIAFCTARDAMNITPDRIASSVIYYTQQTHHCVQKAIRIAGLGHCIERKIELDDRYRMDTSDLHNQIKKDISLGLKPFFIAASCGSTDTGAVDPFQDIASIASEFDIWFHVDGAYGGYFALVDELKPLFKGIEKADSVVLDPHKTLFLPYGSGIVLIRDGKKLFDTFHYTASYLQDVVSSDAEVSPADLSPELTKHFRGLRMWLPLQIHGVQPFRASLHEKHLLALYFHEEVQKLGFQVGPTPQLSVGIYRYVPVSGDANEYNAQLMQRIKDNGTVFVSSTTIDGVFWLRIAIASFRTHRWHIDRYLELLKGWVH